MLKKLGLSAVVVAALIGAAVRGEDAKPTPAEKLQKATAVATAASKSLVIVEYTLQFDKGEAPRAGDLIKEERPLEEPGILLEGNKVVTEDVQIHPRFIKSIAVRRYISAAKDQPRVSAVAAYPKQQHGVILEMSGALDGTEPAKFDEKREGPYSVASLLANDGQYAVRVQGLGGDLVMSGTNRQLISEARGLVVDAAGAPVGVIPVFGPISAEGAWKGDPLKWPAFTADEMTKLLADLDARASKSIVRVMLNFRSPKTAAAEDFRAGGEAAATVQYRLGVMTDEKTVVILAEMKPSLTARLERIKVLSEPPVEAKFKATLTDFGVFVAELEKPVTGAAMPLTKEPLEKLTWKSAPTAEVFLQGEKRVSYTQELRIEGLQVGWRRQLFPEIASESRGSRSLFVFDQTGALIALPISIRQKASTEERYGGGDRNGIMPVEYLMTALSDLPKNSDKDNTPLSEAQENRIAWIGVEMQPLTAELARENNVADQTNDDESGALVTYIYPESPAAKAGVQTGWIFLRINAEGQPKPIEIHADADPFAERPFPWDRLDAAQEADFDNIVRYYSPWPRAKNSVVRVVTELGFGKKYTAEFFHDGKIDKKDFTVVQGPAYFDSAPKYKNAKLGLTVKDLTYEVRRYMQKKADDPGVIVGGIESNSKASKAGIKPFEVITHVNDQPVHNVKDFEKLSADNGELRLSMKRMTKGRIVKIDLGATTASHPVTKPAETAPAKE